MEEISVYYFIISQQPSSHPQPPIGPIIELLCAQPPTSPTRHMLQSKTETNIEEYYYNISLFFVWYSYGRAFWLSSETPMHIIIPVLSCTLVFGANTQCVLSVRGNPNSNTSFRICVFVFVCLVLRGNLLPFQYLISHIKFCVSLKQDHILCYNTVVVLWNVFAINSKYYMLYYYILVLHVSLH